MHQLGCQDWHFSFCPELAGCSKNKGCGNCINDPFCGWCASSATCSEGIVDGPLAGLGEGCKVGYAHAPAAMAQKVFDVVALTTPDVMSSPEGQRKSLADVCKSADKEAMKHNELVISEQEAINATLLDQLQSCLPCTGDWPDCLCEGLSAETNNVDVSYRPGTIYVSLHGDEAAAASVTGGATGPAETPEDAEMRAAATVSKRKADVMTAYMTQYVESIQALTRAKSLGDTTGIAEAELAADEARDMLKGAKAEAAQAADIAGNTYTSDDSVSAVDTQYKALTEAIANKAKAMVSGDHDKQLEAEDEVRDIEASIVAAKEIAAKEAGPSAAENYQHPTTCKVRFALIEFDECCGDAAAKKRFLDGCTASLFDSLGVRCLNATKGLNGAIIIVTLSGKTSAISEVQETLEFPPIVAEDAEGNKVTFDTGEAEMGDGEGNSGATGPIHMDVYEEESSYGNNSHASTQNASATVNASTTPVGPAAERFAEDSAGVEGGEKVQGDDSVPLESVREVLRRIVDSKSIAGAQYALQALDGR